MSAKLYNVTVSVRSVTLLVAAMNAEEACSEAHRLVGVVNGQEGLITLQHPQVEYAVEV